MDQSILTTSIKLNDVDESNLWSSIIEKKIHGCHGKVSEQGEYEKWSIWTKKYGLKFMNTWKEKEIWTTHWQVMHQASSI